MNEILKLWHYVHQTAASVTVRSFLSSFQYKQLMTPNALLCCYQLLTLQDVCFICQTLHLPCKESFLSGLSMSTRPPGYPCNVFLSTAADYTIDAERNKHLFCTYIGEETERKQLIWHAHIQRVTAERISKMVI